MVSRKSLVVFALLVGGLGIFVVRLLWQAGQFRTIKPHFAGRCRLVTGPVGPEDLTIHPRTGITYISACDRHALMTGRAVPGAIFAYDLTAENPVPVNLTPDADTRFQPHGVSLWVGDDGHDVLYVVNHPAPGGGAPMHTVEVFDLHAGRLTHRASLTDDLLVMPNDIVALARDRFYVTNTNAYRPGAMQTLETYLQFSWANVVHYGNGRFEVATDGLSYPNGINVSHDGRTVYVASTTGRTVYVFDRDPLSDALTRRDEIFVGSGADNIEVAPNGDLWIGAHPKMLAVAAHISDPTKRSPSQVIHISPRAAGGYRVDEVYMNGGDELSGSSVAAVRGSRLLIGQIMGDGFLDCDMNR